MNIQARLGLGRILTVLAVTWALAGCGADSADTDTAGSSPAVSGNPTTLVQANTAYSFRPRSAAPAGTSLIFSIRNKPSWASFGTLTGTLAGTPSASDTGDYPNIVIAATDGTSSVTLPSFSIRVTNPGSSTGVANTTSSSSGSSSGGTVASTSSSSSSGGTVASTSSSSSSGGTVASTSSGSSSGGTVAKTSSGSSSSGAASAPAPAPAPAPTADSLTLSWLAPTQNTDGTALTNLAGYVIYYGQSASAMTQKISINTVGMLTYVVTNLSAGTWYFEVVAVNSAGADSGPSTVVSTTI